MTIPTFSMTVPGVNALTGACPAFGAAIRAVGSTAAQRDGEVARTPRVNVGHWTDANDRPNHQ